MEKEVIEEEVEQLQEKIKSLKAHLRKPKLELQESGIDGLKIGYQKNGKKYSVRSNRLRFFYPSEWGTFFDHLKESQKMTFDTLINTGARINEARHIKVGDIDFERGNITLRVTKVRAKKGEKNSHPRTISVSTQYVRRLKSYLKEKNLLEKNESYIDLLSNPAAHIAMKKAMKEAKIKDSHMISVHNIKKTHGNWLRALGVQDGEICQRLGDDLATLMKHYVSPNIFNFKDKQEMRMILGDLYQK